jgi:hypothetical protein
MTATSRRELLGAALALPAAVAAPALAAHPANAPPLPPHPDAGMLELCSRFIACQAGINAQLDELPDDAPNSAALDAEYARLGELADRILAGRARTPDGIAAIARALALHAGGVWSIDAGTGTTAGKLSEALLREVLRLHGDPVPAELREGGAA